MPLENKIIYTIGYANKTIDEFVSCLKKHNIKYLIDVRSEPYSKRFHDYDMHMLDAILYANGIKYVWFGEYFGARRKEDETYINSYSLDKKYRKQVSFQKVYETEQFKIGSERIKTALTKKLKICFMCSEIEPVDCHRFWMVAFYFKAISNMADEVINIMNRECYKTFDQVVAEIDLDKIRKSFYKQNNYEIEGYSLLGDKRPLGIKWWSNFFDSQKDDLLKKQEYANYLIGYAKGDKEYD